MEKPPIKRFADKFLTENAAAELRHFIPLITNEDTQVKIPRDKFGNRVFTSTKSYEDRERNPTTAALLVSEQGERFIRENPKILTEIDKGLLQLAELKHSKEISLSPGRTMQWLKEKRGSQSDIFLLTVDSKKYIIKIKAPDMIYHSYPIHQPYFNEMLQMQTLATDLSEPLKETKIFIPTNLFASGQVSCTEFEEGELPNEGKIRRRVEKLSQKNS